MYTNVEEKRKYQREWVAKRRAEYFKDKCCANCGGKDRLELDHLDPSTKVANAIWSWSASRRDEEIAKCQILCYTCHKARTKEQVSKAPSHGTARMYRLGCRLECCKAAWNEYRKQYEASRRSSTDEQAPPKG